MGQGEWGNNNNNNNNRHQTEQNHSCHIRWKLGRPKVTLLIMKNMRKLAQTIAKSFFSLEHSETSSPACSEHRRRLILVHKQIHKTSNMAIIQNCNSCWASLFSSQIFLKSGSQQSEKVGSSFCQIRGLHDAGCPNPFKHWQAGGADPAPVVQCPAQAPPVIPNTDMTGIQAGLPSYRHISRQS